MKVLNNIKKNTYIVLIMTIIVLYIVLKNDMKDIVNAFQHMNILWIGLAVLFLFLSIIIKGYANYIIVEDKRLSIKEAIKHNIIVQFFNGITPFATGGQPMEIYMLKEHHIPLAKATNRTIQNFIYYQTSLVLCGVLAVTYNYFFPIFPKTKILDNLVLVGFIINVAVAVFLLLVSYCKPITMKICKLAKHLAKKFHWQITEAEIDEKFEDYYNGFQEMKHKKRLIVANILMNIASLLCLYITPLFILYSMTNQYHLTVVNTLTASAYVYIMGAFIPIPGASGGIEYGFTQFFGNFIGLDRITAVLLVWRFITYYLGVILGAIVFNIDKKVTK